MSANVNVNVSLYYEFFISKTILLCGVNNIQPFTVICFGHLNLFI